MTRGMAQVRDDLWFVLDFFPTEALQHLLKNRHRLIRKQYFDGQGNGCLFFLLSESLPPEKRIVSRETLTRFFTGASGYPACEMDVYQPARWLVRLVDEQICDRVRERYPGVEHLPWSLVLEWVEEYLAERQVEVAARPDYELHEEASLAEAC